MPAAPIAPATEFLAEREAARLLGVSPRTLESWRRTGFGPPITKFQRGIRYSRSALLAWAASRTSTSDTGTAGAEAAR
jgi:DNA-binding transcriptional MerR regulator